MGLNSFIKNPKVILNQEKNSPKENSDRNDPSTHNFQIWNFSIFGISHIWEWGEHMCMHIHINLLKTKTIVLVVTLRTTQPTNDF